MTNVIVFFIITISLLIFVVIGWNLRDIIHYKRAVKDLKVGDKYILTIEDDDPFINTEELECTIKEIRYDKRRRPYVKFEYLNGMVDTMLFYTFNNEFKKVN